MSSIINPENTKTCIESNQYSGKSLTDNCEVPTSFSSSFIQKTNQIIYELHEKEHTISNGIKLINKECEIINEKLQGMGNEVTCLRQEVKKTSESTRKIIESSKKCISDVNKQLEYSEKILKRADEVLRRTPKEPIIQNSSTEEPTNLASEKHTNPDEPPKCAGRKWWNPSRIGSIFCAFWKKIKSIFGRV